jgi:5'-deoxynucleotidase YfbR-like HD superfamily hydrolase
MRQGDWIQTYTGKQYWPIDPRSEDIDIRDIAHALSMLCRFGGHCLKFYSVAEHSVHIARWLYQRHGAHVALCGLMHDATEAYVTDVPRPLKPFLNGYKQTEQQNWLAIAAAMGLPATLPPIVKEADTRALTEEARQNMAACVAEWSTTTEPLGIELQYWQPEHAELEFLAAFRELSECAQQEVAA